MGRNNIIAIYSWNNYPISDTSNDPIKGSIPGISPSGQINITGKERLYV